MLVALSLLAPSLLLAAAPAGGAEVVFVLDDPRIDESSGLVSASRADGVVFTHNDSGDDARFFAVGPDGRTRVTYVLPGVQARDWEDISRGPDEKGRSSIWLGDIGDNDARRDNGVLVHRVREPLPGGDPTVTTEKPTSFRLRYPDGPGDAETLLVHPRTGRLYVVGKPFSGPASVYAAPEVLDPSGPNQLARVGEVDVDATGTPGGPGIGGLAQVLITAGDIAPDGTRVAVRTYTDVYEWPLRGDDVAAAFRATPTVTPLPATRQGEGLAYSADGRSLLTSGEGAGTPVHRLSAQPPGAPPTPPEGGRGNAGKRDGEGNGGAVAVDAVGVPSWAAAAATAVAALAAAAVLASRRRRRRAHR